MVNKVPEGWNEVSISDVIKNQRDSLSTKKLSQFRVLYFSIPTFDETGAPEIVNGNEIGSSKYKVPQDCVLLAKLNPRIPRIWRVQHSGEHLAACSTEFWPLIPKSNNISLDFLKCTLESEAFLTNPLIAPASSTKSHQRIKRTSFEKYTFPLPPLPEQKKIAAILSSVDEAIEATEAVIEQTRTVKKGLLQELLTRGIGHTEFKKTAIGEIPKSWTVKQVRETGDVQLGRQRSPHFTEGNTLPYLRVANVYDGYIDYSDVKAMKFTSNEIKQYSLSTGDILLNEGQSIDLVGRSSIYDGMSFDTCCFQNTLIRYRAGQNSTPEFMQALFSHLQYSGVFSSIATQTTSVAHLGGTRFSKLKIPVPPKQEQIEIANILNSINNKTNNETLQQLQTLKKGLLQDLLTGKVRVNTLDLPALLNAEAPAEAQAE